MKLVVDTSAWIEWLLGSPAGNAVHLDLPIEHDWLVPTVVQFELSKWSARKLGPDRTQHVMAHSGTCVVIPLDTEIALAAAQFSAEHKLAMADAIVYATAQQYDADVLTCDAHFETLPGVKFIDKRR